MKTILITGCSSGFGLQMVEDLLKEGHRVIATLRNASDRKSLFTSLLELHGERLIIKNLDVTNSDERKEIKKFIETDLMGSLDILINNAGVGYFGALEDFSEEQIRNQMELNFFAPAFLIREHLCYLRANKGAVINITSIMGQYSVPLGSLYSASKYALEGLTEGLYYELSTHGVSATTIAPGGHRTQFLDSVVWGQSSHDSNSNYSSLTIAFVRFMKKLSSRSSAPSSNTVSLTVVKLVKRLVQQKKLPREIVVGKDAWSVILLKNLLPLNIYHALMSRSYKLMFKRSAC